MDEAAAKAWLRDVCNVSRETLERMEQFVALLKAESERQNLVSKSSLDQVWIRHVIDSAQLLQFSPSPDARWVDLGSGAGFPGLIVALLHDGKVALVEERKLRVDFLARAVDELGLGGHVQILAGKAEKVAASRYDVISARAFAPLDKLLAIGARFATPATRWILPKGRNAKSELESAESSWQGVFHLEPSLTDPDAHIIVADGVRPKGKRSA